MNAKQARALAEENQIGVVVKRVESLSRQGLFRCTERDLTDGTKDKLIELGYEVEDSTSGGVVWSVIKW